MTRLTRLFLAAAAIVSAAQTASAQSLATERGYITAAADFLAAGPRFADTIHPVDFAEAATIATSYPSQTSIGFGIGGGARVWRRLALGVEVDRVTRSNDVSVDAQVPHPFFFNKPRAVSGTAGGFDRAETGVHVVVSWVAPLWDRWQLAVGGGPSWMDVEQDVTQDITVSQTYPYDTATLADAVRQRVTKARVGFNAGAEAAYLFSPHAGLAFGARFAHARIPLTDTAVSTAGGAHLTAGLRLRF